MLVPLSLLTADSQTISFSILTVDWMWRGKNMWASCHTVARERGKAEMLFHAVVARVSAHVILLSAINGGLRMQ